MIISHEHRFIFLKTRKTAGTSVDIALSRFCGASDVISRLNRDDEKLRRSFNGTSAQNVFVPLRHLTIRDSIKLLLGRRTQYTEHMSAKSLKQRMKRSQWSRYFKFCVERNPFDKAISLYYWRTRAIVPRPSISDFLRDIDSASLSNFDIYAIDGRVEVDHIVRFEQLREGLEAVCTHLGLPSLELPRAKGSVREEGADYRNLLGNEERAIVERACSREIELLNYTY